MSTDSVFVHKMWDKEELAKMTTHTSAPFPMLADPCANVGKEYGVYDEDAGINVRGTFIINPDGIVEAYEVLSPAVGRNLNENLRQIQAYQHVREKKGTEAAPMGWTPGKALLTPGANLVGNVWKEWKPK